MSLRYRLTMIIGATVLGLFAVIYLLARFILLTSFERLEQDNTRRNLERATNALETQLDHLTSVTTDWAYWDDTYQFVQDGNADFIENNLGDESLANLNLNLMVYVNNQQQIVYGKAYDTELQEEVPLPEGLNAHLTTNGLLFTNADASGLRQGVLLLPDTTLLVAARPILNSAKEGPSQGTLIFAYTLNEALITNLAVSTRLSLAVHVWNEPRLPQDFAAVRDDLSDSSSVVRTLKGDKVAGYALLPDVYNQPALMLRVDLPRDIYHRGQGALAYFMLIILLLGIVAGTGLLFLLENMLRTETEVGAVLEHSSDAIILVRPDGTIRQGNSAFRQLIRLRSDTYKNHSLLTLLNSPALAQSLKTAVETHENKQLDIRVEAQDGARLDTNVALSPIRQKNGSVTGVLCSLRDITGHKNMEAQLRRMLEREIELNELTTRLISGFSQELCTSITVIDQAQKTLSQYESRAANNGQRQNQLTLIEQATAQMTNLIEDLITLNNAESGKLKIELKTFDLITFCRQITDLTQAKSPTCAIRFSSKLNQSLVCMDQRLVQLIINNLLSNAIKFSPLSSTIYFDVQCDSDKSIFKIRDQGIGILPEDQSRVFEPFFRAENAGSVQGVGLGLAIVKQAVEMHGGAIEVKSRVGSGATFTVTLPNMGTV